MSITRTTRYLDKIINPNSKILDACAGTVIYAFYLAENGHKVTAGDLIEKNVILGTDLAFQGPSPEFIGFN